MSETLAACLASPEASRCNGLKGSVRRAECLECAAPFETIQPAKEFCGPKCKQRWHDRVAARAIELYHLYMPHRYERAEAAAAGVYSIISGLTATWHAEDRAQRSGRRSFRALKATLDANPHYYAMKLKAGNRKRRKA